MANVIDELIVTLGLDSSKFTEGQKKAAQSVVDLQHTVSDSAAEIGSSLLSVASKMTAFFLGFEGIKGVIDLVKNAAYEFKQLGINAELLGTSVQQVRTLQEFSELAGGGKGSNQFGDWFGGIQGQIAGQVFGQIPPWQLLSLAGINPTQFAGQQPEAALKQLQAQIQAHLPQIQGMIPFQTRPEQAAGLFGQALGLPAAMAAEVASPKHFFDDLTMAIKTNKNVTDAEAEAGRKAAQAMIDLRTKVENAAAAVGFGPLLKATELVTDAFGKLAGYVHAIDDWLEKHFPQVTPAQQEIFQDWRNKGAANTESFVSGAKTAFHDLGQFFGILPSSPGGLDTVRGFSGAQLMQTMPHIRFPGVSGAAAAAGAPIASLIGGGGQGGTNNNFAVGSIQVNTGASNAHALLADLQRQTLRKFNVSQADNGMVS